MILINTKHIFVSVLTSILLNTTKKSVHSVFCSQKYWKCRQLRQLHCHHYLDDLEALGFELSHMGNNSFAVQGVPSEIDNLDASQLISINYRKKAWRPEAMLKESIQEAWRSHLHR